MYIFLTSIIFFLWKNGEWGNVGMGEWGEKEEHCALTSSPLHLFTSSPLHQILNF